MTKIDLVKKRLLKGKPITQRIAIEKFDYYRLASGVNRLRNRGMDITTAMKEKNGVQYAEYTLTQR